jgi:hypothetical protein
VTDKAKLSLCVHEGIWGSWGTAPLILKLDARCRWVASLTPGRFIAPANHCRGGQVRPEQFCKTVTDEKPRILDIRCGRATAAVLFLRPGVLSLLRVLLCYFFSLCTIIIIIIIIIIMKVAFIVLSSISLIGIRNFMWKPDKRVLILFFISFACLLLPFEFCQHSSHSPRSVCTCNAEMFTPSI